MNDPQELSPIHFIAQMINQQKALSAGYVAPTRWLCLRGDLQEKYINEAVEIFEEWRNTELETKKNRDA